MYFGTKSYLKSNHYHTPKHPLKLTQENCIKNLLDSVVAGAFQITFRVKIHVNDVFSFFKNYFWHQHIKTIQNVQTILNFSRKKNSNFLGTRIKPRSKHFLNLNLKPTKSIIQTQQTNPKSKNLLKCPTAQILRLYTGYCQ
jgi:hypothetical protein